MRIVKENSSGVWSHKDDNNPKIDLIISNGWCKIDGDVFELYGASSGEVRTALLSDIIVEDASSGGGDETFSSGVDFFTRLKALDYPYLNSQSISSSSFDITDHIGLVDYNDASTASTPIDLVAGEWTDVPNDKLGSFTLESFLPSSITSLIDPSTGYLDFSELTLGSDILIRFDGRVNPNINNALFQARYVLGQGENEYPLDSFSVRCDAGSGIEYPTEKGTFYIYMGDLNTQGGVGKIQVKLSSNGTFKNNGIAIKIFKR